MSLHEYLEAGATFSAVCTAIGLAIYLIKDGARGGNLAWYSFLALAAATWAAKALGF